MCLNYKKIPHQTSWIEYPDIEPTMKKYNIGPTGTKPRDGSPEYTVPAILITDDATGELKLALADSFAIAQYLDEAYPDTPPIFPKGVKAEDQLKQAQRLISHLRSFFILSFKASTLLLSERSRAHATRARAADVYHIYGKDTLEEIELSPEDETRLWARAREGFDALDADLGPEGNGPWYLGEELSFVDIALGAFLMYFKKAFGETSGRWQDIERWNGGRWKRFMERLEPYMTVH